ncbi:hypothetical protein ONZ45_g9647 [Pleurotus djamor]|nr:hypothetical protein ONZ45_g9647 [Pleurotus djamor]
MPNPSLTSFKAIIFDVYGTLVDWETPIYTGLLPIFQKSKSDSKSLSRKEILEAYCTVETDIETEHPDWLYTKVLEESYKELECKFNGGDHEESNVNANATIFSQSIKDWPPFLDTIEALRSLSKHYKLTVLSNVDHQSFTYTHAKLSDDEEHPDMYTYTPQTPSPSTSSPRILEPNIVYHPHSSPSSKSPFTLILTAQDTGAYKPSPNGIGAAIQCILNDPAYEVQDPSEILVVAGSLFHDVYPAHRLGLSSVWIHRQGMCMGLDVDAEIDGEGNKKLGSELGEGKWTWRFKTLGEFAEEVDRAFRDSAQA